VNKIRVLIIDDSQVIRRVLTEILNASPAIEVVGAAEDPLVVRAMIKRLNPDVLTLDIEMPRMDGLTFLRNLMRLWPMPVVMISAVTEHNAEAMLTALSLGAVDFIAKPADDTENAMDDHADEIIAKIIAASRANIQRLESGL
jgi:two-component system chemotaxis response regulator CheB